MNVQEINLNLIPKGVSPVVHVNQYDSGRTIGITLYDGPDLYTLSGTESFVVCGTKENNKGFYYDDICTVTNGLIKFDTTELMTSYPGSTRCVLVVKDGSNVIGTLSFIMLVQKNGIQDNDVVEEENYDTISGIVNQKINRIVNLGMGQPRVVKTSSGMTDNEKIYLYLGSETGYTYGHMYYYDSDSSHWVDSGLYGKTILITSYDIETRSVTID